MKLYLCAGLFVLVQGVAAAATGSADSAPGLLETVSPVFLNLVATPPQAAPGDEVVVTFTASEPLESDPVLRLNGEVAALDSASKAGNYAYSYLVTGSDLSGPVEIEIIGFDPLGNMGVLTDSSVLSFVDTGTQLPLRAGWLLVALLAAGALATRRRLRCGLVLVLLAVPGLAGAAPAVSNVSFLQRPGAVGTSEVLITYDLVSSAGDCTVSVRVSDDGGGSFEIVPESVTGDVGAGIAPGADRAIVWNITADLPGTTLENAVIRVTADDGACEGCLPWSDPASWGGDVPEAGEDVVIPPGTSILLDTNPPPLGGLTVNGTLEFARMDLALTADWIMVHGTLRVGSETAPFTHEAVITLADDDVEADIMGMGTRGILVMGGTLELHGIPPALPWTKIGAHAAAGADSVLLAATPDWAAGDQVVIAPTDFYGTSATERFNIAGRSGAVLTLDGALAAPRWGVLQHVTASGLGLAPDPGVEPPLPDTPTVLDERAEVANLTRNIVVQSPDDTHWQTQGFGVQIMVMDGGEARLDGVEIRRGGQRGELGRYPFHWHMLSYSGVAFLGDTVNQYIRNSVVNESEHRGIVIHGTNGVTVADNIMYGVRGHALFTEDAVERRNTITGNLAIHVRNPIIPLKLHEVFENGGSSGYWIANPDNTVVGNTAADCQGFGFWLAFPENPWGASIGVPMRPSRIEFGVFDNNTAHTSGFEGLMFDFVEISNAGAVAPFQYISTIDEQDPTWNSGTARRFTVSRFTTWKNRRGGIWDRVYWPNFFEIISADNCGRFFAGSGADGVIERCLVVGTSLNNATPRPSINFPDTLGGDATPTAFATYHSAFDMRNNILVNFPISAGERSGAFATEDYYIRPVDKGQMRNPGNLMINTHPGFKSQPVFDHYTLAGALWDPHGLWGPARNYFVYDEPFFTHGLTVTPVAPAGQTGGVSVPGPFYGLLEFVVNNERPYYEAYMEILVTRLDAATLAPIDSWSVEAAQPGWILPNMRHAAVHASGAYRLEFPGSPMPTDVEVRVENMLEATDTLVLAVQFDGETVPLNVYTHASGPIVGYTEAGSRDAVRASEGETWWQDTENDLVWLKLRGGSWQFWDQSGEEAVPSSDELLYETTILHINTDS